MSKAKRIVLAALLPLLAMACVVLAFFAQAPVTRAQAAGSLTVTLDEEALAADPLYAGDDIDEVKQFLTVSDGQTTYDASQYTVEGSTQAGTQTITVRLVENTNMTGTVQINFVTVIPVRLEISMKSGYPTVYSHTPETILIGTNYIQGNVYFNNAPDTPVNISEYIGGASSYLGVKPVDLRTDSDTVAAGQTYTKNVTFTFTMNGETIESAEVPVTVTMPTLISLAATPSTTEFVALTQVEHDDFFSLVVVSTAGVYTLQDGDYTIVYEDPESDSLQYGNTSFTVKYKEGAQELSALVSGIVVTAKPVSSPVPTSSGSPVYNGTDQSLAFSGFDGQAMEYDVSEGAEGSVKNGAFTLSAREAGTYTVTFTVKTGFRWRTTDIPAGAKVEYADDGQTIISFTYTWQITQATLTGVSFDIEEKWTYKDTGKGPTGLTLTSAIEGTVSTDGATVTYTYKNAEGTPSYNSGTLPTEAGTYTVTVSVSGLKNYAPVTDADEHTFTISPRSVELPTLQEGTASVPYTGRGQAPTVIDNYKFEAASNAYTTSNPEQVNAGVHNVTFTLTNTRNYVWENGTTEVYTLAWEITTADNEQLSISAKGWKYVPNQADMQQEKPSATFRFTNKGVSPEFVYEYKGWEGDTTYADYTDITSLIKEGKWDWRSGYYRVFATYQQDTENAEIPNFNAFEKGDGASADFIVSRMKIGEPTLTQKTFDYTGTEYDIAEQVSDIGTYGDYYSLSGDIKQTNAGHYTLTITLKGDYTWSDDTRDPVELDWTILRAVIPVPTMDGESETTYTGSVQTKNVNGYQSDIMSFDITSGAAFDGGSKFTAKNVGEYILTISFAGDNAKNYYWANGDSNPTVAPGTVKLTWNIAKAQAVIDGTPSVDNWTYDTKAGTPTGADPDAATGKFADVDAYYAWSDTENGEYTRWTERAPTQAGNYWLKFIIAGTSNFNGAETSAEQFKVLRATVAKPTFADGSAVYDGNAKTSTVSGYIADRMTYTTDGVADDAVSGTTITLTAKGYNEGGYYIQFTLIDPVNYTWFGSSTDPEEDAAQPVLFKWAISKADNEVLTTGTFKGWTFGEEASATSDLGAYAKYDEIKVTFAVYKAGEVGTGEEQTISNALPAGDYVLRASIAAGANTNAAYENFEFTVSPNTGAVVKAEFADVKNWTYGDDPHDFTAEVTVGTLKYGNAAVTVTYRTKGWGSEWSSVESLSSTSPAGVYEATFTINANDNYSGNPITVEFTIKKYVVSIPDFDRNEVFDNAVWTPTIPAGDGVWGEPAYQKPDSSTVGVYWLTLTLTAPDNYEWDEHSIESYPPIPGTTDKIEGAVATLWYRITRTTFNMQLSVDESWTYGSSGNVTIGNNPGSGAVTYLYTGRTDNGTDYSSATMPTEAGTYKLTVTIAETNDYDSCEASADFTILPKQLTVSSSDWSNISATYGQAAAASASAAFTGYEYGEGYAALKVTYSYTGSTFLGDPYEGSDHPVHAGEYTVRAELGNKNYYISGTAGAYVYTTADHDYTINKAELILTANGITVTYGQAASGFGYKYDGLVNNDVIGTVLSGITLTYEAQRAGGGLYQIGDPVSGTYVTAITNTFNLNDYFVTPKEGTMTLNPATLTVDIHTSDVVYTGDGKQPSYDVHKAVESDVLTFTYTFYEEGDALVGEGVLPTEVGRYYVVVTLAGGEDFGNYESFSKKSDVYEIKAATLTIVTENFEDFYTGRPYVIKDEAVTQEVSVNGREITWEFSLLPGDDGEGDFSEGSTITSLTDVNGGGAYTVYYRVSAPNHATQTGSFSFNIQQEKVQWSTEYARKDWTYGSAAGAITDAVAKFANSTPDFLDITVTYYRTYEGGEYSDVLDAGYFNERTPAGTYYAVVSVADAEENSRGGINWLGATGHYSFTVNKAVLTLKPNAATADYGTAATAIEWNGYAASGMQNGEQAADLLENEGYTLAYTAEDYEAGDHVGSYTVTMQVLRGEVPQTELANYTLDIQPLPEGFTVTRFDLTVTVTNPTELTYKSAAIVPVFGDNRLSFNNGGKDDLIFTYTYFVQGEGGFTSMGQTEPVNVGTYYVVVTLTDGADMGNYSFDGKQGDAYTIVPKKLTDPRWSNNSAVYGEAQDASVAFDGVLNNEDLSLTYTYDGAGAHPVDVDTYTVEAKIGNPNYCAPGGGRTVEEDYTITQATLTLTPNAATAIYGTEASAIVWKGYTATGWKYDDEGKDLLAAYTPEFTAVGYAAGSASGPVGRYDITMTLPGADLRNYTIDYATLDDGFTVTKRPVTIGIVYRQTIYGDVLDPLTWHVLEREGSYDILEEDRASASQIFTLGFEGEAPVNVGKYKIVGTFAGTLSGNYAITFIGQNAYGGNDYELSGYGIYEIIRRTVGASISPSYDSNVYDGSQKGYTAKVDGGAGGDVIAYELQYKGRNGTVYPAAGEAGYEDGYTTVAPKAAGDYTVTLAFTDPTQGGNYQFGGAFSTEYSIAKATYGWASSVRFNDAYSPTFRNEAFVIELIGADLIRAGEDGAEVTVRYYSAAGLVLTVVYGADGVVVSRTPGVAGITHVSESGAWWAEFETDSPNYTLPATGEDTQFYTKITVTPRVLGQTYEDGADTVSIVWSSQERFTYNGENQKGSVYAEYTPLGAGSPERLVLGDVDFTDYAAQGYTFTVTGFGESDAAAGDYALPAQASRQHTYHIDRRAVTIAAADGTGTYGDTPAGLTWKYTGDSAGNASLQFVESDGINFTVTTNATNKSNVGGDYFTAITAVASGEGRLFNYEINGGEGWRASEEGTFTVEKRDLEVTVTANGVTYTGEEYGTQANVTVSSDAVNDDVLAWTYTYWQKQAGGDFASLGESLPVDAGTYYVVVTFAEPDPDFYGNKNGNYAFVSARSGEFVIELATIVTEGTQGFTAVYTGEDFVIEDMAMLQAEVEGNMMPTVRWTFSLIAGEDHGDFSEGNTITSLKNVKSWNGSEEGVYTVYFMVTANNHAPAYGIFEVTIERAVNSWEQEYLHAGWEYKGDDLGEDYDFLNPTSEAVAAFGTVQVKYYTDESCDEQSEVEGSFFNAATPAGTYYAKAFVADNSDNYSDISAVYEIVVRKHVLEINWLHTAIALNDTEKTENFVVGYAPALMNFNDETPGLGFDAEKGTASKPGAIGDYYVTLALVDPANYEWLRPLAANATLCRITFSVNTDVNNVTVTVTGGGWTYGDSVTFGAYEGTAGEEKTVIVVADSLVSVSYTYAVWKEGDLPSLSYTMSSLPQDAGRYVVRAFVQGETGYGANAGYAVFTVSPREVTAPSAGKNEFTYERLTQHTYTPDGFASEITLPDGRKVALMTLSDNTGINAGSYTAYVSLASTRNFVWSTGGTDPVELSWKIDKQTLTLPTLGTSGVQSSSTVYGKAGLEAQGFDYRVLTGFDAIPMSIEEMVGTVGYRVVDGKPAMTASGVGTYTFVIGLKDPNNYEWKGTGETTVKLIWTVTPATYDMSGVQFGQAEYTYTYNGQLQYPTYSGALPEGLDGYVISAQYSGGATHVSDGRQTVTVTFTTASPNYVFENSTRRTQITATVSITPLGITNVRWTEQKHFTFNGEDQSASVTAEYETVGGTWVALALNEADFTNYTAEGYTFTVAGFTAADNRNGNYALGAAEGASETYYIDKLQVTVAVGDQTAVYTGQAAQLSSVAGSDYLVAADNADVTDFALENGWNGISLVIEGEAVNAGTYAITLAAGYNDALTNFTVTDVVPGEFIVTPAPITVNKITVPESIVYGSVSGASAASVAAEDVEGIVSGVDTFAEDVLPYLVFTYAGTANDGTPYSDTQVSADMKAGSYTVTVTMAEGGNYYIASPVSEGYVVARMQLRTDVFSAAGAVYDGTPHTAQVACTEEGYAGLYTAAEVTETEAGSYEVAVTLTADAYNNYRWENSSTDTFTLVWSIERATAEEAVFGAFTSEDLNITNWGAASGGVSVENAPQFWFVTNEGEKMAVSGYEWSADGALWTNEAPTAAGSYYVRAYAEGTENYDTLYSGAVAFVIGQGTYDMSGVTFADGTFVYDGSVRSLAVTGELPVGADGVAITFTVSEGSADVVERKAVQAVFTSHSSNYVFEGGESTYTLTAYLTVTAHGVQVVWEIPEYTYDGTVQHSAAEPTIKAYYTDVSGEKVYLTVGESEDGEFRNWREGGYTFTVTDDDANYLLSDAQAVVMMNKAAITVTAEDKQSVYGEAEAALTYVLEGETYGQNVTVTLSREAGTDAGTYAVTAQVSGAENFDVTLVPGTYTITKASIAPSVTLAGWTYGSTANVPEVSGAFGGEVSYLYSGTSNGGTVWNSSTAPVEAGSYTLTVTVAESQNRLGGSASVQFIVSRMKLAAPTLGEGGESSRTEDFAREIMTLPLTGFDPVTMGVSGIAVSVNGSDVAIVATSVGTRTAHIYLKDTNNYEWATGGTDELLLTWVLEEPVDSMIWLIATLGGLFVVELILLAVALVRRKKSGGTPAPEGAPAGGSSGGDAPAGGEEEPAAEEPAAAETPAEEGGEGDARLNALAFAPLALLAVPAGQMGAIIALGIACAALAVADIVLFVKKKKPADAAEEPAAEALPEPAEEPAPAPVEEPVAEEPAAEEPVAEEPAAEEPVAEEPVAAEPAVLPVILPVGEEDEDEWREGQEFSRYNFSFRARLIQSGPEVQSFFGRIMDEINAHEGVKTSTSWRQMRVYKGRKTYALILFKGKTLCVAYALDPAEFAETKYHGQDMSEVRRFEKTPMLLKVFSERKAGYACWLFAEMFSRDGIARGELVETDFSLPYESTRALIERGLVKVMSGDLPEDEPAPVLAAPAEEPAAEEPAAEEPAAEEPAAEEIAAEEPAAEEPVAEEPVAEEPVAEEPVAEEPVAEEPVAEEPAAEEIAAAEDGEEDDLAILPFPDETEEEDEEEEPEEDEASAESEEEDVLEIIPAAAQDADWREGKVFVRYNFSFRARLIQSSPDVQRHYGEIMDEINAYDGVKTSISWRQMRVYKGRKTYALILFKGKKLCVAYALDPAEFAETKYRGQDKSEVRRFAKTPMLLKVFSDRKSRYARWLLAEMFSRDGIARGEAVRTGFLLPYRSTAELIEDGLVKVMSSGEAEQSSQVEQADIAALIRERITLHEAQSAMTDEAAAALIEDVEEDAGPAPAEVPAAEPAPEKPAAAEDGQLPAEEEKQPSAEGGEQDAAEERQTEEVQVRAVPQAPAKPAPVSRAPQQPGGKKGIVNIDSLSRAFAPGDVVTVAAMQQRKLLKPGVGIVKVLARGALDKPLIVEAHDFSLDAVKMILLTGGKVHRLHRSGGKEQ